MTYIVSQERSPCIFKITQSKINRFERYLVNRILTAFHMKKMLLLYLVKCRSHASDRSCTASLKNWTHFKQPVVSPHSSLNFRQATLQELLKLSTFCSSYFRHQLIALSALIWWNSTEREVAVQLMQCVHMRWLTQPHVLGCCHCIF